MQENGCNNNINKEGEDRKENQIRVFNVMRVKMGF